MRNDRTGGIVSRNRFPTLLVFYILFTVGALFMLNREVSAMSQVSCLVLIVAGIFLHIDDLICLIAAILPTGNVFMLGGGNTAIPFLLLIYIMKSIIRCGGRIDIDAMRPLLWAMLLLAISIITTTLHSVSIMKIIPFYMHIVFIVFALRVNHINDESMYRKMSLYFVAGTLLVCAGTVFFPKVSRAGKRRIFLDLGFWSFPHSFNCICCSGYDKNKKTNRFRYRARFDIDVFCRSKREIQYVDWFGRNNCLFTVCVWQR